MDGAEFVGMAAGALTTLAFVPQVLQVWRTRSARDISLKTFSLFTIGIALWIAYGALLRSPAILAANVVTFGLACAILVGKLKFDR